MRRLIDRDAFALDAFAAVLITAAGLIDVLAGPQREGAPAAIAPAVVVLGALVLWRRRAPAATGYAFAVWLPLTAWALTPPQELVPVVAALVLFPYAIGSRTRGAVSYAYVPVMALSLTLVNVLWDEPVQFGDWIFPCALAGAAYLAGRNVIHRTALAVELHEAALRAAEQRDAEARRAVRAERRRIAHEMHDVVAHSLSVMVVQAGGARRILERDPDRAGEAAAQIERTGRETLLEMRRLLGVMRRPDQAAELEPNPTLDGLTALVGRARETGLPVTLRIEGERRPLSAGLELGAYRVVQDALDDVLRLAPGAHTEVRVRWTPGALEITVADDRPGVPFAEGAGPELIGVRERVALYGGELRTGQRPGGGHEVHVRFPLDDSPGTRPDSPDTVPAQGAA